MNPRIVRPVNHDSAANLLEESCTFPRHTLAGIDERAETLTGPYGTRSQFAAVRMELLRESIAEVFGTWGEREAVRA